MVNYQDFTPEELMMDAAFQQWVRHPNEQSDLFWEEWRRRHPEKAPLLDQAREALLALQYTDDLKELEVEAEWAKLQGMIAPARLPAPAYRAGWWQPYRRLAAVLAGLALLAVLWMISQGRSPAKVVTYVTAAAQTKAIRLPDGSRVILNASSRVTFPASWKPDAPREVWLQGEAFFSVQHTRSHQPFIVHTDSKPTIEVLGTRFNVYSRRQKVQVVLQQGKVQIAGLQPARVIMQPGELVEWQGIKWRQQPVDTRLFTSWTRQELLFEQAVLAEVANKLQDNYGLPVHFANETQKALRFTGSLPTNDLEECLHTLATVFDLDITRQEKQLLIR